MAQSEHRIHPNKVPCLLRERVVLLAMEPYSYGLDILQEISKLLVEDLDAWSDQLTEHANHQRVQFGQILNR